MALTAAQPAMTLDGKKHIHPFFSKQSSTRAFGTIDPTRTNLFVEDHTLDHAPAPDTAPVDDTDDDPDFEQPGPKPSRKKRARKTDGTQQKDDKKGGVKSQASLEGFTRRVNGPSLESAELVLADTTGDGEGPALDQDPNPRRSKRRKTASPAPLATSLERAPESLNLNATAANGSPVKTERNSGPSLETAVPNTVISGRLEIGENETGNLAERPSHDASAQPKSTTPKKRVLRVRNDGRLISPSAPKVEPETAPVKSPKKRRGRPPKPKRSKLVVIKYGSDVDSRRRLGQQVDDIFSGVTVAMRRVEAKEKVPPKPAGPPKPPHPFFTGKVKNEEKHPFFTGKLSKMDESNGPKLPGPALPQQLPAPRKTSITPAKLRAEARAYQLPRETPPFRSVLGHRVTKSHGSIEAPWPTKDSVHVRNVDGTEALHVTLSEMPRPNMEHPRKLKRTPVTVTDDENIITRLTKQLSPMKKSAEQLGAMRYQPSEAVRLPTRLLTTGVDIQTLSENELRTANPSHRARRTHPAVKTIFAQIEHTMTPFDNGECETQAWTQKYAPHSAACVLQAGKEAFILRDWLQSLTVMTVQNAKNGANKPAMSDVKKPPKKKRKTADDDWIVSDEDLEESTEMVGVSDNEDFGKPATAFRSTSLRSAMMTRNKNVVVLSGPHGCGKSAAVYAVAKELGFEVFEINSSSRRSGKDIQDKVGDMSENHLVNHHRKEAKSSQDAAAAEENDSEHMDQALQKDLESGRQGTMTSFFTSEPRKAAKSEPKAVVKTKQAAKAKSEAQATLSMATKPGRHQKQSLILFEEADILFEDDQQFWLQVTKLASQSKRPLVITCTNEDVIPLGLPLGAILRFTPPPVDVAADYLLTLAAKEGHVLERKAVADLYESRSYDLRASITELNFWCQMTVGDRKGGLDWIYQRWPPGKDVDENGRILRVASKDTYRSGMGYFSNDILSAADNISFDKEEALLKSVWSDWGISPTQINPEGQQKSDKVPRTPSVSSIQTLDCISQMLEATSSADVYCRVGLPSYDSIYDEPTDPSLPPVPEKEKLNYTVDTPFVQVDPLVDFMTFDTDMTVESQLSIRRAFADALAGPALSTLRAQDGLKNLILMNCRKQLEQPSLSRPGFSAAFDGLAYPPDAPPAFGATYPCTASSFDRTFRIVVEDLAPFVRCIVSYEIRLEQERLRIGNLLSEGGRSKRPRTTRASRVAQEGGTRATKRKERWFAKELNRTAVMATAGKTWAGLGSLGDETEASSRADEESLPGTQEE